MKKGGKKMNNRSEVERKKLMALIDKLICLSGVKTLIGREQNLNASFGRTGIEKVVVRDPEILKLKEEILSAKGSEANV
ncbi:MAG: hypothetical protein ABIG60_02990 [Patescibacteria group bacterium]